MSKFFNKKEAVSEFSKLSEDFYVIHNPSYVYPPYEIVPLAPKKMKLSDIKAIVCDMDGTTTTTEELCLHSLEYMVRKITNRLSKNEWKGLDVKNDYPNIIGNSTTKHVEFLLKKYKNDIKSDAFKKSFLESARWTLTHSKDKGRIDEVKIDLSNLGILSEIYNENVIDKFELEDFTMQLKAAITIYYYRYHYILSLIQKNEFEKLESELGFSVKDRPLIMPMFGVRDFLLLVKGVFKNTSKTHDYFIELFKNHPNKCFNFAKEKEYRENLKYLLDYFSKNPLKVGIVTSSIFYEANIVMNEVFKILRGQLNSIPPDIIDEERSAYLFKKYENYYDAFITANHSSEIRLKPHRDLYSISLHVLGINPCDFDKVIGFEDSESGTVAIRAAGINMCVAVPFYGTQYHNLQAASYVLKGGLLQSVLEYKLFMN